MRIEYATAADLPELLDFLHAVFRRNTPDHPRFETLYPDLLIATDEAMSRHAVVRENGRIVSCVGIYPMLLQAGGCRVPIAGVGQVSTDAAWLGRGYMSALLRSQLDRARAEGAVLAWLGGRHDRYAHFGFDVAGLSFRYGADRHSTSGIPRTRAVTHIPATPDSITPELFALRESTVDGVLEPLERYRPRMKRTAYELWCATPACASAPDAWAIATLRGNAMHIAEWCGSDEGRLELFAAMADEKGSVVRDESIAPRALNEALRRHCAWMGTNSSHLAVLNRQGLLDAYRALIPAETTPPPADLDPQALLRHVFGPESSPFPHLPFLLPEFDHV